MDINQQLCSVEHVAKALDVSVEDWEAICRRYPRFHKLTFEQLEVIKNRVENGAKGLGVTQSEFMYLSKRKPTLLTVRTETTLKHNVANFRLATEFGADNSPTASAFTPAVWKAYCHKEPSLLVYGYATLRRHVEEAVATFGCKPHQWLSACRVHLPLFYAKIETLMRKFEANRALANLSKDQWLTLCMRYPMLFSMTPKLMKHNLIQNAQMLNISVEQWSKSCQYMPCLYFANSKTLKKHIIENAKVAGLSQAQWIICCLRSPSMFFRDKKTLKYNIDNAVRYLNNPSSLPKEDMEALTADEQRAIRAFRGLKITKEDFVKFGINRPVGFTYAPATTLLKIAQLDDIFKRMGCVVEPKLKSYSNYIAKSAENIQMRLLYYCYLQKRTQAPITRNILFQLVNKQELRDALSTQIKASSGKVVHSDAEIIAHYPCPVMQRLKQYQQTRS